MALRRDLAARRSSRADLSGLDPRGRLRGAIVTALGVVVTALSGAGPAGAAQVNGTLAAYESPAPQGGRYLHFQNSVTGDCYMTATNADGGFGAQLPPGVYDLRAERGAILAHRIAVGDADRGLGRVSELAPYAPQRLWQYQTIAPAILTSPAPSTANIMTVDRTALPPSTHVIAAPADLTTEPRLGVPAPTLPPTMQLPPPAVVNPAPIDPR